MTTPDDKTLGVMDDKALSLALLFHETYERLAPNYGYETRIATRKFDPDSPNGQLMIAVCGEIYRERIAALEAERDAKDKQLTSCYERMVRAEVRVSALGDTLIEIYNCYDKGGNLSEEAYVAIDAARAALKEGR